MGNDMNDFIDYVVEVLEWLREEDFIQIDYEYWDEDTLGEAIGRELYSTYGKVYEDFRSGYGEDKDLNDLNIDIEVEAKQLMYS